MKQLFIFEGGKYTNIYHIPQYFLYSPGPASLGPANIVLPARFGKARD